jgi:hypothetical protein
VGDQITIFTYYEQKPFAVVLEKKEIADTFKSIFKLAREAAKKYDEEESKKNGK